MIVTGLDLSLTSTGIATINTTTRAAVVDRIISTAPDNGRDPKGKKLPATLRQRTARLHVLRTQIVDLARTADLVVIEGPSYGSNTGSQHERAGLHWLVVHRLTVLDVPVVEVPPTSRMKYATGKGQAGKDVVLAAVVRRYPDVEVTGNDEADALVLAAMGARWLGAPVEPSLPAACLAAMGGVHWPEHPNGAHE